jgi:hypothetical protein
MIKPHICLFNIQTYTDIFSINGDVTIWDGTKVPNLKFINGDVKIFPGADLPKLEAVMGNITIFSDVNLPKLEFIKGDLHIREYDLFPLNMKYIKGNVIFF